MRTSVAMIAVLSSTLLVVYSGAAADQQEQSSAKEMVEKVRRLPASALDSTQADIPLEQWLLSTLGTAGQIDWAISDCDLKPPPRRTCVTARRQAKPGEFRVRLHVFVDTMERGAEKPSIAQQSFIWKYRMKRSETIDGQECMLSTESLNELRRNVAVLKGKRECE